MSSFQTGPNNGLSGEIEFPTVGTGSWRVKVFLAGDDWNLQLLDDAGRSDGAWPPLIPGRASGTIVVTGKITREAFPNPTALNGAIGTLTKTLFAGVTETMSVRVFKRGASYKAASDSLWDVTLTCQILDMPASTGWPSTQQTASDTPPDDKILWAGLGLSIDPSSLANNATYRLRIWGITDSFSAEATEIRTHFSDTAPDTGLKLRDVVLSRATANVVYLDFAWGLTTHAEDVVNPRTVTNVDPNKIQTGGTSAAINDSTPTLPTVSGQTIVERTTSSQELNDGNQLYVTTFGQLNTQDDITYPGTHKDLDVSDLTSTGLSTSIFADGGSAATAPNWTADGIQPVTHSNIRINRDEWRAVDVYAKDTPKQSWQQEHSHETTDSNQMASEAESGAVDDATPTVPVNASLVIRYQRVQLITHDHTGYVDVYGLRTTIDDVEYPGTHARVDISGLKSEGLDTNVYTTSGGVPNNAGSPDASLQAVATEITRINRVNSQKVTYFDVNTTAENVIFPEAVTLTDPSGLKSTRTYGSVYTTGSEPGAPGSSGLVLRNSKAYVLSSPNTSNKSVTFWLYAETTTADDEIFQRTRTETDPQDIDSVTLSAAIFTTGSPPIDPSTPTAGLKLTNKVDIALTDASASNKSIRVYRWEKTDSADKLIFPKTSTTDDANNIEDEAIRSELWAVGATPPATPTAGSPSNNVKLITFTDVPITPTIGAVAGKNLRVWLYGPKDSRDKLVLPNYETVTDASDLASTAIRAYLDGESAPATPAGLQLRDTKVVPVTVALGTNRTLTVLIFGKDTRKQEWEQSHSSETTDTTGLISKATSAAIDDTTPPAPVNTDLKLRTKETIAVTNDHDGTIAEYGLTTPVEDIQRPGSEVEEDPNDLASTARETTVYDNGGSPATGAVNITLPTDVEIDTIADQQLNDGKWKRLIKWATNNSKNLWERLKKKVTTDVGHVAQEAIIVKILGNDTPVADDTYNTDTTNLEFSTVEITPVSATQFAHVYTFSPLSATNRAIESFKQIVDDPVSALVGDDQRRIIDANATTAAPAVSGQVCIRRLTHKIGRTLYQHDYWYAFRSVAAEHIAKATTAVIDVSGLESEAFTAEVWTVAGAATGPGSAPYANLVNISARYIEIENPLYRVIVYGWALVTNTQKAEYGSSVGHGDPFGDLPGSIGSVVATTLGGQAYADTITAANTNPLFLDVEVHTLTPAKAMAIIKTARDEGQLTGGGSVDEDRVNGIPDPGGSGFGDADAVQKCSRLSAVIYGGGGGATSGLVLPISIWRARGVYEYIRYVVTDDVTSVLTAVDIGSVNTAAFHGFPAHTLMFGPPEILTNFAIASGHRVVKVKFRLFYDNYLHFSDANLATGWVDFNTVVSSPGYFDPATYVAGGPFMDIEWPPADDFSVMDSI